MKNDISMKNCNSPEDSGFYIVKNEESFAVYSVRNGSDGRLWVDDITGQSRPLENCKGYKWEKQIIDNRSPKECAGVEEFISTLVQNEGVVFGDDCGRKWVYNEFEFFFCDLGKQWESGLKCLHLYGTRITKDKSYPTKTYQPRKEQHAPTQPKSHTQP